MNKIDELEMKLKNESLPEPIKKAIEEKLSVLKGEKYVVK